VPGRKSGSTAPARAVGAGVLRAAPWLMRGLSVAGTAAMFLVGGSILAHALAPLGHAIEAGAQFVPQRWNAVALAVLHAAAGMVAGMLVLLVVQGVQRMRRRQPA
jgi:uncharacterized protein